MQRERDALVRTVEGAGMSEDRKTGVVLDMNHRANVRELERALKTGEAMSSVMVSLDEESGVFPVAINKEGYANILELEYRKIKQKRSKLSRSMREKVVAIFEKRGA